MIREALVSEVETRPIDYMHAIASGLERRGLSVEPLFCRWQFAITFHRSGQARACVRAWLPPTVRVRTESIARLTRGASSSSVGPPQRRPHRVPTPLDLTRHVRKTLWTLLKGECDSVLRSLQGQEGAGVHGDWDRHDRLLPSRAPRLGRAAQAVRAGARLLPRGRPPRPPLHMAPSLRAPFLGASRDISSAPPRLTPRFSQSVYPQEKVVISDIWVHKQCLKCSVCSSTLSLNSVYVSVGTGDTKKLFCKSDV